MSEIKIKLAWDGWVNSRLDTAEEKIREFEVTAIETIQD